MLLLHLLLETHSSRFDHRYSSVLVLIPLFLPDHDIKLVYFEPGKRNSDLLRYGMEILFWKEHDMNQDVPHEEFEQLCIRPQEVNHRRFLIVLDNAFISEAKKEGTKSCRPAL